MKKTNLLFLSTLFSIIIYSCTSFDDVKEISGTLIFNEIGTHSFSINAENIEATVTVVGPDYDEILKYENIKLSRTANYTAKIGLSKSYKVKTELLNNLVVMYEAKTDKSLQDISNVGYIKIDWKGLD